MALARKVSLDELVQFADEKSKGIKDFTPFLKRARVAVRSSTLDNFRKGKSPDGKKWRGLRPLSTRSRRKRSSSPLRDTGILQASLASSFARGHVEEITPNSLKYGTNIEYAATHQFGEPNRRSTGGALAIPLKPKAKGFNPRKSPKYPGKLVPLKSRKGNLFLADADILGEIVKTSALKELRRKRRGKSKGTNIFPALMYLLKKRVSIPARPFMGFNRKLFETLDRLFGDFVDEEIDK